MSIKQDRILLQKAAQAAGLQFDPTRIDPRGLWVVRPPYNNQDALELWNSLRWSVDAFQLAATLRLLVDFNFGHVCVVAPLDAPDIREPFTKPENQMAAACRAITRMAAAIEEAK